MVFGQLSLSIWRLFSYGGHTGGVLWGADTPATRVARNTPAARTALRAKRRPISCRGISIPFTILALHFSLLPSHNSGPGSQNRRFSLLPTTVRAFVLCGEKTSALPSLVDSRLLAPYTHATRAQRFIICLYFLQLIFPHKLITTK